MKAWENSPSIKINIKAHKEYGFIEYSVVRRFLLSVWGHLLDLIKILTSEIKGQGKVQTRPVYKSGVERIPIEIEEKIEGKGAEDWVEKYCCIFI